MSNLVRNGTLATDIVVKLENVSKIFEQRRPSEKIGDFFSNLFHPVKVKKIALEKIDLEIKRGEIVAYAGVNGAGKSTTVRILSGLLAPSSGRVAVLGLNPIEDRIKFVGRIGVIFGQRTELWWDHPVASSFEWKKSVWNIPQEIFDRNLSVVKEILKLDEFFNTFARELSLGQRMRADLGLMLMHDPEIIFMDEPTLGLDVVAKKNILEFIKAINQEKKTTIMITSHDMDDLEYLASRLVMIHQGKIAFDGDFSLLRETYANKRILKVKTKDQVFVPLQHAEFIEMTEDRKLQYIVDLKKSSVVHAINELSLKTNVEDIETFHLSMDEVIASIFETWQRT